MKLSKKFGAAALGTVLALGALAAGSGVAKAEQAPSTAQIDVCTSDGGMTYMDMTIDAPPEAVTYELWGQVAEDLRETVAHFTLKQLQNDDDLLMAAMDSFGLKFRQKHGFNIAGGPNGPPPHKCQEPLSVGTLPPLYVGHVDACIADKSKTVSVLYGIVTNPSADFRKAVTVAIGRAIESYNGDMNRPDGIKKAITDNILQAEKAHGGETFFYFAPSGALQEGCHPAELAL